MNKRNIEHWLCVDCSKDCIIDDKDYYMIKHSLWNKIGVGDGMLCMKCLENRLGHKLKKSEILLCLLTESNNPYTKKILNKERNYV